jgi:tetratricopeptide (TPR) repeat protein
MAECAGVYADEATKLMLLGQSADAATNLTHAMQLQPHAAELRIRRAAALRQQGKLREAIGDLEVAISEAGGTYPEAGQLLVLAYNDLGVRLAQQKLHEEAVRWFSSAIDANGSVAAFFLNRADCLHALGRTVEALADLERARDLSPHDAQTQWSIRTRLAMVCPQPLFSTQPSVARTCALIRSPCPSPVLHGHHARPRRRYITIEGHSCSIMQTLGRPRSSFPARLSATRRLQVSL